MPGFELLSDDLVERVILDVVDLGPNNPHGRFATALRLSHTCRRVRQVALGRGSLWNNIQISATSADSTRCRHVGVVENCASSSARPRVRLPGTDHKFSIQPGRVMIGASKSPGGGVPDVGHLLRAHLYRTSILRLTDISAENLGKLFPSSGMYVGTNVEELSLVSTPLTEQVLLLVGPHTTRFTLDVIKLPPEGDSETDLRKLSALFARAPCLRDVCLRLRRVVGGSQRALSASRSGGTPSAKLDKLILELPPSAVDTVLPLLAVSFPGTPGQVRDVQLLAAQEELFGDNTSVIALQRRLFDTIDVASLTSAHRSCTVSINGISYAVGFPDGTKRAFRIGEDDDGMNLFGGLTESPFDLPPELLRWMTFLEIGGMMSVAEQTTRLAQFRGETLANLQTIQLNCSIWRLTPKEGRHPMPTAPTNIRLPLLDKIEIRIQVPRSDQHLPQHHAVFLRNFGIDLATPNYIDAQICSSVVSDYHDVLDLFDILPSVLVEFSLIYEGATIGTVTHGNDFTRLCAMH